MSSVEPCPLPEVSLLRKYGDNSSDFPGSYVDCYAISISRTVTLHEFVFAFYTTPLFKLERLILRLLAGKASTDLEARKLADGDVERFSAWSVEQRSEDQLLMCDMRGQTRSWFMVTVQESNGCRGTLLRFGSAVVARNNRGAGNTGLGFVFHALLVFHKLYSRLLLGAAKSRLEAGVGRASGPRVDG